MDSEALIQHWLNTEYCRTRQLKVGQGIDIRREGFIFVKALHEDSVTMDIFCPSHTPVTTLSREVFDAMTNSHGHWIKQQATEEKS